MSTLYLISPDLLGEILAHVDGRTIGRLHVCGSRLLSRNMCEGGGVRRFDLTFARSLPWPSLVYSLRNLQALDITYRGTHCEASSDCFERLPSSLTSLSATFSAPRMRRFWTVLASSPPSLLAHLRSLELFLSGSDPSPFLIEAGKLISLEKMSLACETIDSILSGVINRLASFFLTSVPPHLTDLNISTRSLHDFASETRPLPPSLTSLEALVGTVETGANDSAATADGAFGGNKLDRSEHLERDGVATSNEKVNCWTSLLPPGLLDCYFRTLDHSTSLRPPALAPPPPSSSSSSSTSTSSLPTAALPAGLTKLSVSPFLLAPIVALPKDLVSLKLLSGNASTKIIALDKLPPGLTELNFAFRQEFGAAEAKLLPPALTSTNADFLTEAIPHLPYGLKNLTIKKNSQLHLWRGTGDSKLPPGLQLLNIPTLELAQASALPPTLKELVVTNDTILTPELAQILPRDLQVLSNTANFSSPPNTTISSAEVFRHLPRTITELRLQRRHPTEPFVVQQDAATWLPEKLKVLELSSLSFQPDMSWFSHMPQQLRYVSLSFYNFDPQGMHQLSQRCPSLQELRFQPLSDNAFIGCAASVPHLPYKLKSYIVVGKFQHELITIAEELFDDLPPGLRELRIPGKLRDGFGPLRDLPLKLRLLEVGLRKCHPDHGIADFGQPFTVQ